MATVNMVTTGDLFAGKNGKKLFFQHISGDIVGVLRKIRVLRTRRVVRYCNCWKTLRNIWKKLLSQKSFIVCSQLLLQKKAIMNTIL